jgi:hypothetical protein
VVERLGHEREDRPPVSRRTGRGTGLRHRVAVAEQQVVDRDDRRRGLRSRRLLGCLVLPGLAERFGRRLTLGFYFVGSFLLISGFFVGNRGPVRVKNEGAAEDDLSGATPAPMILPIPGTTSRKLRWASLPEQNEAINNSAIFIVLGLVLVFIGIGFDSHHSLF